MKLKSLFAPKSWPTKRKAFKWVSAPKSSMRRELTLSINVILRDLLKWVMTTKEVKRLVFEKKILLNGKFVKKFSQGVSLFDVISFVDNKKSYRLSISEFGKLTVVEDSKNKDLKVVKLFGKTILKNKVVQLNFNEGTNVVLSKSLKIRVGECALLDLKTKKVVKVLPYATKASVLIVLGSHVGSVGKIVSEEKELIKLKVGSKEFKTLKDYVYVFSSSKEEIKVR